MARQMKYSGVEWIGEIPADWETIKLKYACYIRARLGWKGLKADEYVESGYPLLSAFNIINSKLDFSSVNYINQLRYDESPEIKLQKGDILLVKDGAGIGKCAIIDELPLPSTANGSLAVITAGEKIHPDYLYYYFLTPVFQRFIDRLKDGMGVPHLFQSDLREIRIVFPAYSEQHRIAAFLDTQCSKIDAVLAQTRSSIEEYKKLKQAVITQAVTKGVRGERAMKDSGIEWIGEIEETRTIERLKFLLRKPLMYGANESGIPYEETLPRYIRITDITMDGKLKESGKLSLTEEAASEYILENNDVLFARSGATVGKAFIYKEDYGRAAFAGYLIKASVNLELSADYLFFYTQSSIYEEWKKQIFVQATIQNIGADRYNNLPIVLTDIEEQRRIVSYLNEKCSAIDTLIAKKEQALTELENYKKSLIYEYVTGKKEVME